MFITDAIFAQIFRQNRAVKLHPARTGKTSDIAQKFNFVPIQKREKILPRQPRGFYREYTVKTPGARNRGALRIVCGGTSAAICYFSRDHYQTFRRIKE